MKIFKLAAKIEILMLTFLIGMLEDGSTWAIETNPNFRPWYQVCIHIHCFKTFSWSDRLLNIPQLKKTWIHTESASNPALWWISCSLITNVSLLCRYHQQRDQCIFQYLQFMTGVRAFLSLTSRRWNGTGILCTSGLDHPRFSRLFWSRVSLE